MSTITVVVPVFNQEKLVDRCIKSVLDQTYKEYILILVDDGSCDRSGAICDEMLLKYDNVFVIHEKNMGLSYARNMGINFNSICFFSDWITFIDSDDWVNPRYFELMIETANNSNVSVVASDYTRTEYDKQLEENDEPKIQICSPEEFIKTDRTTFSVSCCKLFNASCFDSIRFPVGKTNEDEFTSYKILFHFEKVARILFPLYNYYVNPNSITRGTWTPKRLDALDAFRLQIDFFRNNGYKEAYLSSLNCYMWVLYDFSKIAQTDYPELAKRLKEDFAKELIRYKEYFPISQYGYYYSYVNPFKYKIYLAQKKLFN